MFEMLIIVILALSIANIVVALYAKSVKIECKQSISKLEAKIEENVALIKKQKDTRVGLINALVQFKAQFEPRLLKLENGTTDLRRETIKAFSYVQTEIERNEKELEQLQFAEIVLPEKIENAIEDFQRLSSHFEDKVQDLINDSLIDIEYKLDSIHENMLEIENKHTA